LTIEELKVLKYDFQCKKSLFRAMHMFDIHLARKEHAVKADKIPIYILVGEASSGKSEIGQYVGNVIGTSSKPIVNYRPTDQLALNNWVKSGSDILIFDDFSFVGTKRDEPSQMFNQLKSWTSGIPIDVAFNQKNNDVAANTKVNGVIISVNQDRRC
jgi:hypothetical protein